MIRLSRIVQQISEAGRIENPFSWTYDFEDGDGNVFYTFKTPKYTYSVAFTLQDEGHYELFFNTVEDQGQDTEEGIALKVLSTVTAITKSFIEEREPEEVIFRPIKTKGEEDERRFRVYKIYIQSNLPSNYSLLTLGNTFRIIKK